MVGAVGGKSMRAKSSFCFSEHNQPYAAVEFDEGCLELGDPKGGCYVVQELVDCCEGFRVVCSVCDGTISGSVVLYLIGVTGLSAYLLRF